MYFDTLKADYREHCLDPDYHIENKQRINLSKNAAETLLRDAEILSRREFRTEGRLNSTILNHIFRCFFEAAESSVEQSVRRWREELEQQLEPLADTEEKSRVMELLTRNRREKIRKACTQRLKRKGISVNFRIDLGNLEHLVSENCQQEAEFYKNQVGEYMKAVLEEYAELPFVRRERIFCKEVCDEIQKALVNQNLLKLTLRSVSAETGLHNVMYVKPYRILTDSEQLYNYLTGFSVLREEEGWLPVSVRLSSVLRCEVRLSSGFLSGKQIRELQRIIQLYGVQYMSNRNSEENIVVRLTPGGERLYGRMLHLRPAFTEKSREQPGVCIFTCSPRQAENYFFNFGAEAEILEPAWLREEFQKKYRAAAEVYEK